jgi:Tfp pilus assembly protein PilX
MMVRRSPQTRPGATRRRGAALIAALICVLLVSMMSAVLVKTALVQREQLERDAWQVQADWLAQSAMERALARLESDVGYAGESWAPVTSEGKSIGRVNIDIIPAVEGDTSVRRVRATADAPDDPVNRARVVREWKFFVEKMSVSSSDSDVNE